MIPWTQDGRKAIKKHEEPCKGYYACDLEIVSQIKQTLLTGETIARFKTIECSIMDVADDIAYSTYDIEDSFAAGFLNPIAILSIDDKIKDKIVTRIRSKIEVEFPDLSPSEKSFSIEELNEGLKSVFATILGCGPETFGQEWTEQDLSAYVGGEVYRASHLLAKSAYQRTQFTSDLIGLLINKIEVSESASNPVFWQIRPSIDAFLVIETLKMICYLMLIESDKFLAERRRARHVLKGVYRAILESGADLLPDEWRNVYQLYSDDDRQRRRLVCDFVSGMTNRYCIEFYRRVFGPEAPSISKP